MRLSQVFLNLIGQLKSGQSAQSQSHGGKTELITVAEEAKETIASSISRKCV